MRTIIDDADPGFASLPPSPARPIGKCILVVEDDPGLMSLYEILLQSEGYSILGAETGEDAVKTFERASGEIDLLITDVFLPRIGAVEMLSRMKAFGELPRVLVCSGAVEHHTEIDLREAGATRFLAKPFRNHQILGEIQQLLFPCAEAA